MTPEKIITTRKALGLTQAEFARLFDAHPMTVSKWERGVLYPTPYQASLMEHFKATADAKRDQAAQEVKSLLVGAGVVAALIWLLSNAKK